MYKHTAIELQAAVEQLKVQATRDAAIIRLRKLRKDVADSCTTVDGLKQAIYLRQAVFKAELLPLLFESIDVQPPTNEVIEECLHLIHNFTNPKSAEKAGEVAGELVPGYSEPDPVELSVAMTHPGSVALALNAMHDYGRDSSKPHVTNSYIMSLISLDGTYEDISRELLELLRDKRVAAAMWRCLCSKSLSVISMAAYLLKRLLGGHGNPMGEGLEGPSDSDEEDEDTDETGSAGDCHHSDDGSGSDDDLRGSGRRILLREFIRLGGGAPLGAAMCSLAGMALDQPAGPRSRGRGSGSQASQQTILQSARVALELSFALLTQEGAAARALVRRPVRWPQELIEGHMVTMVMPSLRRHPFELVEAIGSMAPYAHSEQAAAAFERVASGTTHVPGAGAALGELAAAVALPAIAAQMVNALMQYKVEDMLMLDVLMDALLALKGLCSHRHRLSLEFVAAHALVVLLRCLRVWGPWQRQAKQAAEEGEGALQGTLDPEAIVRSHQQRNSYRPCKAALSWAAQLLASLAAQQQEPPPAAGLPAQGLLSGALAAALAPSQPSVGFSPGITGAASGLATRMATARAAVDSDFASAGGREALALFREEDGVAAELARLAQQCLGALEAVLSGATAVTAGTAPTLAVGREGPSSGSGSSSGGRAVGGSSSAAVHANGEQSTAAGQEEVGKTADGMAAAAAQAAQPVSGLPPASEAGGGAAGAAAKRACLACGSSAAGGKLKRCSGCNTVWFCGVDCQRRAWPGHRAACRATAAAAKLAAA